MVYCRFSENRWFRNFWWSSGLRLWASPRQAWWRDFPFSTVAKDIFDNYLFGDETQNLHFSTALGTLQRIHLVNQFYQGCPAQPELSALRRVGFKLLPVIIHNPGGSVRGGGTFAGKAHPTFLVTVPTVVANLTCPAIALATADVPLCWEYAE